MTFQFEYLADRPQDVSTVIDWWYTVWADRMGSKDEAARQLAASLNKQDLPIHVLATRDGQAVGTAALKLQELAERYPDRQYWLGSVFVDSACRGAGLASELAEHIVELARQRGLPHLHLQTIKTDGGLYARLGWRALEEFDYRGERTLLMIREL